MWYFSPEETAAYLSLLATALAVALVYASAWYVVSLLVKRMDVADVAWGLGITLVGMVAYASAANMTPRLDIAAALVILWGFRLSLYIFKRNGRKQEDARYRAWREAWGRTFLWRSYLQVFALQGILMVVVGYPLIHLTAFDTGGLGLLDIVALVLWLIGFVFEAVGDRQLTNFVRNPGNKGRVLTTGLWRYSRHPNYFGEVTQWWALGLLAFSTPFGFLALVSPLAITFLIVRVSGIPMLEKAFEGNSEFEAYRRRTSAFFPLPPRP